MRGSTSALKTCLRARSDLFFPDKRAHHLRERVRRTLLEPTLRWHAMAVSPWWQPTRPDADAAYAEPGPGADLESDRVWHGLAAKAPAHGHFTLNFTRSDGRPSFVGEYQRGYTSDLWA